MLSDKALLPPWRSMLFVPADKPRFVERAHTRGADAVILDLEDSVADAAKAGARDALAGSVAQVGSAGGGVLVRINAGLLQAVPDLEAAVIPGVQALVIPKVVEPGRLQWVSEAVTELELARGIPSGTVQLVAQIESPRALPMLECTD